MNRKKSFLILITVHLSIVLLVNVYSTMDSFRVFYHGQTHNRNKIVILLDKVLSLPVVWHYSIYAGIDAGYGFYAPNVASRFSMSFSLVDSTGFIFAKAKHPNLYQAESIQRFDLCLSLMQQKLGWANSNELLNDFIKVMIHQIAMDIKKDFPKTKKVFVKIYLHNTPTVQEYMISNKKEQLVEIEHYLF